MKTFTKMFSVWCWCMCMCTVVLAKEAVTQEEVLNPTLEPLTQLITPEQKLQLLQEEENSIASQKAAELQIAEAKRLFVLEHKLQLANDLLNSNGDPISIETQNDEVTLEKVKEEILVKGYTVQEYIIALNADKASIEKEGAVSYETYLEYLEGKEQATSLEYNLQPVENTEGKIVTNAQTGEKVHVNDKDFNLNKKLRLEDATNQEQDKID